MSSLPASHRRRRLLGHDNIIPLEPEITPSKFRQPLDDILNGLNARWNLDLPYLHGTHANDPDPNASPARQCSRRLRYLSYRAVDLQQLLSDFDRQASLIFSGWKFKPHAEHGVTINRSTADSDLARRVLKGKLPALSIEQRESLLSCLNAILEAPYEEARRSDSFRSSIAAQSSENNRTQTPSAERQSQMTAYTRASKAGTRTPTPAKRPGLGTRRSTKRRSSPTGNDQTRKQQKILTWARPNQGCDKQREPQAEGTVHEPDDALENDATVLASGWNKTSSAEESTDYSLNSTQELTDFFNDQDVKQSMESRDSGFASFQPSSLEDRLNLTINDAALRLPPAAHDYTFAFELQSIALLWSRNSRDSPITATSIWREVIEKCQTESPTLAARHSAYKAIAGGRAYEAFTLTSWDPSVGLPPERLDHKSLYQDATLSWSQSTNAHSSPFDLRLHAPRSQQSCRFHRMFRGDRFLTLTVPDYNAGKLPSASPREYREAIASWLYRGIDIAHRHWRPFWVDDKAEPDKDGNWVYQIHLFATTGIGLENEVISLKEFLNIHAPFEANKESANHKLFARCKLGLSKTTPTLVLHQDEFLEVDDIRSESGNVMTDGCALMSASLGSAIAAYMALAEVPAAYQGRIGGAKGVWLVDKRHSYCREGSLRNRWIEIRPSQLKIEPHPAVRDCDDEIRRFEVCSWSKELRPSSLNAQVINVLYNGGVRRQLLGERLKSVTTEYYNELLASVESNKPIQTRLWLQKHHAPKGEHAEIQFIGGRPMKRYDQIKSYLDIGFDAKEHKPLHELVTDTFRAYLDEFAEKPRIELAKSTFALMVPDFWGFLEEGEVQLCLSKHWANPETGMTQFIADVEGLVARNPANHPSDVQRIKFVQKDELVGYENVIFFSTKGQRPLADFLSGGDYDGDQAFVCWDQEIAQGFRNFKHGPPDGIFPEDVRLIKCSTKLSNIFAKGINEVSIGAYIKDCIAFSLRQSFVGIVTNEHVAYVYKESLKNPSGTGSKALESKRAIELAALAAFLVDASKQGYDLPSEAWSKYRRELRGDVPQDKPPYQCPGDSGARYANTDNVLDYLRFDVAQQQVEKLKTRWHQQYELHPWRPDEHLLAAFRPLDRVAADERRVAGHGAALSIWSRLKSDLDHIYDKWKRNAMPRDNRDRVESRNAISEMYELYRKIQPLQVPNSDHHPVVFMLNMDKEMETNMWQSIRASYVYKTWHWDSPKFVRAMAGLELSEMKARKMGPVIPVKAETYGVLKLNTRAARTLVEANVIQLEEDVDLGEEEETQWFDAETTLSDNVPQTNVTEHATGFRRYAV